MHYLPFCILLISLHIMFSSSIHIVANGRIFFSLDVSVSVSVARFFPNDPSECPWLAYGDENQPYLFQWSMLMYKAFWTPLWENGLSPQLEALRMQRFLLTHYSQAWFWAAMPWLGKNTMNNKYAVTETMTVLNTVFWLETQMINFLSKSHGIQLAEIYAKNWKIKI